MSATGYLSVRVFTSSAQLPISGATVSVTQKTEGGDRLLATRITDESGKIPPSAIPTPPVTESQVPGNAQPFAAVDVTVDTPGYERILVEDAQIFPGILTVQDLELIPIEAQPEVWNMTQIFPVTAQPL